jgi:hypothetical protein
LWKSSSSAKQGGDGWNQILVAEVGRGSLAVEGWP